MRWKKNEKKTKKTKKTATLQCQIIVQKITKITMQSLKDTISKLTTKEKLEVYHLRTESGKMF